MELENKIIKTPRESAIKELMSLYSLPEEHARRIVHSVWENLNLGSLYDWQLTKPHKDEKAVELRKRLVEDIKKVIKDCNYDCFYNIDDEGKISFNETMDQIHLEEQLERDKEMYYDIICEDNIFYDPIERMTEEELNYLINKNDIKLIHEYEKNKIIGKINEFETNKITDINLNDEVPLNYQVDFYLNHCGTPNGLDMTEDVIHNIKDDLLAIIRQLSEEYGFTEYIYYICDFIKNTCDNIKIPIIPKEKLIELISKYYDNSTDKSTYYDYCISEIDNLKKKFERKKLEKAREELNGQALVQEENINKIY